MFSSRVRFYFCHFCLPLYFFSRANYIIFNELVLNLMTFVCTWFYTVAVVKSKLVESNTRLVKLLSHFPTADRYETIVLIKTERALKYRKWRCT